MMRWLAGTVVILTPLTLFSWPSMAKSYSSEDDFKLYQMKRELEAGNCASVLNPTFIHHPNSTLYFYQGLCLLRDNQPQAALEKFDQAVKLNPDDVDSLNNIGIIYGYHLERPQEALEIYEKIIKKNPKNIEFRMNRALLLEKIGNYREALLEFQQILRIKPDAKLAWYMISLIQYHLGNYKDAIANINRAIWLNPNFIENYTLRGIIRIKRGHLKTGCQDLKKAVAEGQSAYAQVHLNQYCQ
jgi:tetratricopeptide (TPR) repeat protein